MGHLIRKLFFLSMSLLLLDTAGKAFAFENTFYILRDDTLNNPPSQSAADIKKINILIPQAYVLTENGTIVGTVNPHFLDDAKKYSFKLMPLITNQNFDNIKIHRFLHNKKAQNDALQFLLNAGRLHHFYGYQFDLENVHINDRDALSNFFKFAAETLHRKGYVVSFTIVPVSSDQPPPTEYWRARYENWSAAYDYATLGKYANFVTLMAYDQNTAVTTPGPVAGYPWVEKIIRYARQYIPAKKIYLGIPTYSDFWFTQPDIRAGSALSQISYSTAMALISRHNAQLSWDANDKVHYTFYSKDELNEYIFIEDAASFKAKLDLAKKYGLGGISVWRLNMEDPGIWQFIK